MRRPPVVLAAVLHCCIAALGAAEMTQEVGGPVFLARAFGLSNGDLRRIERGEVLSRSLPATDKREIATLGIVRMRITPEFYAKRLADIANFKKDPAVLQIGTFGEPARHADVGGLTLDASDLRSLRRCRVGDCDVQLPAESIAQFNSHVDWSAPDAERAANTLMRERLVAFVNGYRRSGAAGMVTYADHPAVVDAAAEFRHLVESDDRVLPLFPTVRSRLLEYPASTGDGSHDVIYWSKEKVRRTPVVTVTHLAIMRPPGPSPADCVVASKQIYASHYFDASLGLTILLRDRRPSSPATYLAYVNRSRIDVLTGAFGGIARRFVRSGARSAVSGSLERLKTVLERDFAATVSTPADPPSASAARGTRHFIAR